MHAQLNRGIASKFRVHAWSGHLATTSGHAGQNLTMQPDRLSRPCHLLIIIDEKIDYSPIITCFNTCMHESQTALHIGHAQIRPN